jgi:hypothetical protein
MTPPIDWGALHPDTPTSTEPPPGIFDAILQRADVVETNSGSAIVTEWTAASAGSSYWWTAWFGFDTNRLKFTIDFLDAVGLDRRRIAQEASDEALKQMLSGIVGDTYRVKIERKGAYTNTYVLAELNSRQQTLEVEQPVGPDAPIDTRELPEPVPVPSEDDDPIPF